MKSKIVYFFQTIKNSVYHPEWYGQVIDRSLWNGVKYFFALSVLTVSLGIFLFTLAIFPVRDGVRSAIQTTHQQIETVFPDDLILTFQSGELSTNMPEPYAVPMPEGWRGMFQQNQSQARNRGGTMSAPKNLVVFDTTKTIERGDFEQQDTLVIVSKNEVGYEDVNQGKVEIRSFGREWRDAVIDKTKYVAIITDVWNWLYRMLPVFAVVLWLVLIVGTFIGNLIYMLAGALAVWLGAAMVGRKLSYSQAYKAGLYLLTLPLCIATIFRTVPLLTTALLVLLAAANFRETKGAETEVVTQKKPEEKPIILPEAVMVDEAKP